MSGETPFWIYILIPFISGLVGFGTNVLALWMTFYPIEFVPYKLWQPEGQPFGLFGWQGIIPSKAEKMSKILCQTMTEKLLDIPSIFGRMDPAYVAEIIGPAIEDCISKVVDSIGREEAPAIWLALSERVKDEVSQVAAADSKVFIEMLLEELQDRVLQVLDLENLVVSKVKANKQIVVDMFQSIGAREFVFIRHSGFYFGFVFGLVQAGVYVFYKAKWVLPAAGFLVGYLTNMVALKMIFAPAHPINLGCYSLQGLFLKRQTEVSHELSKMATDLFIQQPFLWDEIYHGKFKGRWDALVADVTERFVRAQATKDTTRRVASALMLGEAGLQRIHKQVAAVIDAELPNVIQGAHGYMDEVMDVEATMRSALLKLPSDDFVNILRPVFQEDEIKLILVGGVLGAAAGCVQQFLIFDFIT